MTAEHDDCRKNHLTTKAAGYSANQTTFFTDLIHQELQQFVNHMPFFQQESTKQELTNDKNQDPNPQPAPDNANAALTTNTLKEIFKSMMQEHKSKPWPRLNLRHKEKMKMTEPSFTAIPMVSRQTFGITAPHANARKRATTM
jgi:hypothetical protein